MSRREIEELEWYRLECERLLSLLKKTENELRESHEREYKRFLDDKRDLELLITFPLTFLNDYRIPLELREEYLEAACTKVNYFGLGGFIEEGQFRSFLRVGWGGAWPVEVLARDCKSLINNTTLSDLVITMLIDWCTPASFSRHGQLLSIRFAKELVFEGTGSLHGGINIYKKKLIILPIKNKDVFYVAIIADQAKALKDSWDEPLFILLNCVKENAEASDDQFRQQCVQRVQGWLQDEWSVHSEGRERTFNEIFVSRELNDAQQSFACDGEIQLCLLTRLILKELDERMTTFNNFLKTIFPQGSNLRPQCTCLATI